MAFNLLIGAPGTMLSSTGTLLGQDASLVVFDVEATLIASLSPADRREVQKRRIPGKIEIDMAAVTRAFPREKVLALWEASLNTCLGTAADTENALLVCHLTLYRNDRSEFYSALGPLTSRLIRKGQQVDEVVVLIDDVYDMYLRLADEYGALNAEDRTGRWMDFTKKATPKHIWETLNSGGANEAPHLGLETKIQTLNLLVSWRRQESLAGETLARALDARFTVLGIKHSKRALQALISSSPKPVKTIYISHPISAYRRAINSKIGAGEKVDESSWEDGVTTCNRIPSLVEHESSLVAIMPTAIDELRFQGLSPVATRLTERAPILGPRWPLMDHGVGLIAGGPDHAVLTYESAQHPELLIPRSSPIVGTPFGGQLARFLEGLIFIEIPYRDHLIVANSDGLLVFRPLADRARLSSGVNHEVRHWWDKVEVGAPDSRLAVLHEVQDLRLLKSRWEGTGFWFQGDEGPRAVDVALTRIESGAGEYLESERGLEEREIEEILLGHSLPVEHLGGRAELTSAGAVEQLRSEAIIAGVAEYIRSELDLSRGKKSQQLGVFLIANDVSLTNQRAKIVRAFLEEPAADSPAPKLWVIGDEGEELVTNGVLGARPVVEEIFGVDVERVFDDLDRSLGEQANARHRSDELLRVGMASALEWYEKLRQRVPPSPA